MNSSLSLDHGDSVCVLGENGSGKSTLLRIISGLLKPDKGSVKIFDRDPYKQPENLFVKQRIGVLMHSNMLYPQLTLKENLLFCPLGGSGEIGMNMNLYAYGTEENQKWIIVDMGVTFADD